VRRRFAWVAGGFGAAALLRALRRRRARPDAAEPHADPASELRRRLAEARDAADDRDEFDAAEGVPIDQVEPAASVEDRRRAVHEQAQAAIDDMRDGGPARDE
jgi:hypothetical protein